MAALTGQWQAALSDEFKKPYCKKLYDFVRDEYLKGPVYPPSDMLFKAFELTEPSKIKAVIIGQDPYHNAGQAMGLCFSVNKGIEAPPSLVNIYKELHDDIGFNIPDNGDLTKWAGQGVFLLNSILTVKAHQALSHAGKGWEEFTDAAIKYINTLDQPIVFMLWGAPARKKAALLDNPRHLVLEAPHPSPLSAYRGFFGCKHFSKANDYLVSQGLSPIDWQL